MRITIVIDDADAAAATETAQTISRAFVRAGSGEPTSASGTAHPSTPPGPVVDVDAGPAPHVEVSPPSPSGSTPGSTSGSGSGSGSSGNGSQPATPDPSARPAGESAGAAPELGGG